MDAGRFANLIAVGLAVAAVTLLFVAGTSSGYLVWSEMSPDGIAVMGLWVVPALLCAVPLAFGNPRARHVVRVAAAALLGVATLATFSVFFVPAAVAMVVAAAQSRPRDARDAPTPS